MALFNCDCSSKCKCTLWAVIASVILGVVAAFLQITAVITVTTAFLWVLFGIAVVYLGVLVIANALNQNEGGCGCKCTALSALLAGIVGTILFSVILLAVGVVAASVISAILVGLLVLSFALTVGSSVCYVKCLSDCCD